MPIKLRKLPDRVPVKVSLSLSPELHQSVLDYAEMYRKTYGEQECEPVTEILPYIIQDYLDNDKAFAKARRTKPETVG
jgi:hypothetical protein